MKPQFIRDVNSQSNDRETQIQIDLIKKISKDFESVGERNMEAWKDIMPNPGARLSAVLHAHNMSLGSFLSGAMREINDFEDLTPAKILLKKELLQRCAEVLMQMQVIISLHTDGLPQVFIDDIQQAGKDALELKRKEKLS